MSWYVTRGERTDGLADALGDLLATPLDDPLAQEVVVVPARGMERWLTQRLAHRLGVPGARGDAEPVGGGACLPPGGVCAGVRFLSPKSLAALLTGRERDDPWDPDRLVWPVLQAVDDGLGEPWCATIARHLGVGRDGDDELAEVRAGRRYSLARRLAGLFASYGLQRPGLLADWRRGRATDGAGGELDADLAWQPELWRRVLERVDADPPDVRHAEVLERLRSGDDALDLPGRLSLFGHTRIPRTEIELLSALAARRDVHLWLPQVSERVWADLAPVCAEGPIRRADDRTGELVDHPLLASLGRDSRELQRTLALAAHRSPDERSPDEPERPAAPDPPSAGDDEPATTLGWLQHDLRLGRAPSPAERASRTPPAGDDSIRVHACHGPARQVEVLREALVGLLADDPSLEPRDIIVMCPDIEAYAPLVQAAFGLGGSEVDGGAGRHPAHRLRVRLADRALTATNPLAALASDLLTLVGGRMTAGDVLDIAGRPPVRRRFGLDDDDLDRITRWVEQAAIRWGRDAGAREPFALAAVEQNTWRFGLDRILLGVATAEHQGPDRASPADEACEAPGAMLPALPVDDVAGADIDLVGKLAELLDRLGGAVERLEAARTAADWTDALASGVREIADVPLTEAWQAAQLDRELAAVAEASDPDTRLRLADVRGLLDHRFAGHPTRANFRTGTLTVSTMVPMRSVPHRVVALLGLDDGVFPRHESVDGDDVLARAPLTGERDGRSEDRQLLLDAIMAATEHLVVTYTGASEHAGSTRPPAVPLGEVVDAVRETVAPDPEADAAQAPSFVVRHRLQPFAPENFVAGALGAPGVFSFDAASLAGARVMLGERPARPPLLTAPLPAPARGDIDLDDLLAFFVHPARHFLRGRLEVSAPLESEEPADAMPVALDALEKWAVGDRLLAAALAGVPPQEALRAERLRGLLPPGGLGDPVLRDVGTVIDALVATVTGLRAGEARSVDVDVDLGGGRRLAGTVPHVYGPGSGGSAIRHVTVGYSSLSARKRLEAWITLLALTASSPDGQVTSHAVGRRGSRAIVATAGPLDPALARDTLADLVEVYDRGGTELLPAPPRTGLAYAEAHARGARGERVTPEDEARKEWEGSGRAGAPPGEAADAWNVAAYGPGAPLSVLLGPPREDEGGTIAPHRLDRYALRIWEPILAGQEVR